MMNLLIITVTLIVLLPVTTRSEPLIRVCSSSEYKRIVEDTCSSVYKRSVNIFGENDYYNSATADDADELIGLNKRRIEDEKDENNVIERMEKIERDISVKCCVLGCPYSLYAAHCDLRKRNYRTNYQQMD